MGILIEAVRSIRTNVKLRRGQCGYCRVPLRDDATGRYCSDACAEDAFETNVY